VVRYSVLPKGSQDDAGDDDPNAALTAMDFGEQLAH
jgi:hypothetical protein